MLRYKKAFTAALIIAVFISFTPALWAQEASKININTATAEEIAQLKGIGPTYAERIVQHRNENGPYQCPEDLTRVKGIGPKIVENNKERIDCTVSK